MKTLKKIGKKVLEVILATTLCASLASCKPGDDNEIPWWLFINKPPVISTSPLLEARENELYSYDVDATDADNDTLTYSLETAPTGMTINPDIGVIEWTPTDTEASQNHNITVKVDDGKDPVTQSFQVYVKDKSTITFNIKNVTDDTDLIGMEVKVGTNSAFTNGTGTATLIDILEGEYQVEVNDTTANEDNYFTYKAGKLISNKTKKDQGELDNLVLKSIPKGYNMNFFNETCRSYDGDTYVGAGNGKTQRISDEDCQIWRFYMDTNPAVGSGNPVTQPMKDNVINIVENDWYTMTDGKLDITEANGKLESGITPPAFGTNDYSIHLWDDNTGGHYEYMDTDKIKSTYSRTYTTSSTSTYKHELMQELGARWDSNLGVNSVLDNITPAPNYTTLDIDTIKILYNRPIGNQDLGTQHEHDVNPSDHIINP